jgi:hypothetical protein
LFAANLVPDNHFDNFSTFFAKKKQQISWTLRVFHSIFNLSTMKLWHLLLFLLIGSVSNVQKGPKPKQYVHKFRGIKTWTSNKTIKDLVVYIKNYNRTYSTLNGHANFIGKGYDTKVSF